MAAAVRRHALRPAGALFVHRERPEVPRRERRDGRRPQAVDPQRERLAVPALRRAGRVAHRERLEASSRARQGVHHVPRAAEPARVAHSGPDVPLVLQCREQQDARGPLPGHSAA